MSRAELRETGARDLHLCGCQPLRRPEVEPEAVPRRLVRHERERALPPREGRQKDVCGQLALPLPDAERKLRARRDGGADLASALAVLPNRMPGKETPLWSDAEGRLVALGGDPPPGAQGPWLFSGIQAATERLLPLIPEGKSELAADVLRPSLARGERAFALVPYETPRDGLWFDLGTPERLTAAEDEARKHGAV